MFKQSFLPGFPEGAQRIGASLSILERDGQVIYFVGGDNDFSHPAALRPDLLRRLNASASSG